MNVDLYTRIGDRFRNILSIAISEDDLDERKGISWDSTISIRPSETGFYDILVERKGNLHWLDVPDDLVDDIGDRKGNVRPIDVFRFNGTKVSTLKAGEIR